MVGEDEKSNFVGSLLWNVNAVGAPTGPLSEAFTLVSRPVPMVALNAIISDP